MLIWATLTYDMLMPVPLTCVSLSVGYANCTLGIMYTGLHIHILYKAKGHTHVHAHTHTHTHTEAYTYIYTHAEGKMLSTGGGRRDIETFTLRLTIVHRSMAACRWPDISGY